MKDEALILKYRAWKRDIDAEKQELLERLKYLYREEKKLTKWICELKGEAYVK